MWVVAVVSAVVVLDAVAYCVGDCCDCVAAVVLVVVALVVVALVAVVLAVVVLAAVVLAAVVLVSVAAVALVFYSDWTSWVSTMIHLVQASNLIPVALSLHRLLRQITRN